VTLRVWCTCAAAGFGMMPGMWNPMTMMNAMGGPAAMVSFFFSHAGSGIYFHADSMYRVLEGLIKPYVMISCQF
jgi:hypothetical protein